jgi:hypothetical protein
VVLVVVDLMEVEEELEVLEYLFAHLQVLFLFQFKVIQLQLEVGVHLYLLLVQLVIMEVIQFFQV